MARIAWFDSELLDKSWFEPELTPEAWFDSELIDTASGGPTTQSLAFTLDDISVSITQTLRHTQSVAFTLDDVALGITQYRQKNQSLAITLDDLSATINQTKTAASKTQSISFLLDDVEVSIGQLNDSAPVAPIVQGGGNGSRKQRTFIIEVDGKDYRVPEGQINQFLASIQVKEAPKSSNVKQVKRIGKSDPVVVIKSAPVEMVERLQQDFDYANAKINALFIKALERYQQDIDDEDEILLLLM